MKELAQEASLTDYRGMGRLIRNFKQRLCEGGCNAPLSKL
jgi:hypothetical protein